MSWYEARLDPEIDLGTFYKVLLDIDGVTDFHHFWNEPWWPNAYVARIFVSDSESLELLAGVVDHVVVWDSVPDEELFGSAWEYVREFFQASSALSLGEHPDLPFKLVHCFLNARGMSRRAEARFAARFLWRRLTIGWRWKLYLRRRYERQDRREAAA